jgi:threonine-phosphate decarboxylase
VACLPRLEGEGFAVNRSALAQAVGPGDLVLFSNPSNPAGGAVSRAHLLALRARCEERGATLAVDEAFADFCPGESVLADVAAGRGLVVFRSLTKFYGIPGLRLGFLAAAPEAVGRIAALQVPWSVSALAQEAGIYCLSRSDWGTETLGYVARAREALGRGLSSIPGLRPLPSRTNYLLVELSPPAPQATDLYDALARRGILVRHCGSFGLGERYVRVAVRTEEENETLLDALRMAVSSPGPPASDP